MVSFGVGRPAISPEVGLEGPDSGENNELYSFQLVGNAYRPPITWTLQSGPLPTGLSLSSAGLISGTPTQEGTFPITVRATPSEGSFVERSYSLIIGPDITITAVPQGSTTAGSTQDIIVTRSDSASGVNITATVVTQDEDGTTITTV